VRIVFPLAGQGAGFEAAGAGIRRPPSPSSTSTTPGTPGSAERGVRSAECGARSKKHKAASGDRWGAVFNPQSAIRNRPDGLDRRIAKAVKDGNNWERTDEDFTTESTETTEKSRSGFQKNRSSASLYALRALCGSFCYRLLL